MVNIQKINPLQVFPSCEILVTDGFFKVHCFSQGCFYKEGDELKSPLCPFDVYNVTASTETAFKVKKVEYSDFAYEFIGALVDKRKGLVRVGDIIFNLNGHIPVEAVERGFISFGCCRIDIDPNQS